MRVCFPRSGPPSTLCRQPSPTSATWSRSTGAAHPPGGFTCGASISDAALACRRLVECCEEEVVIDYASDLNTSACVWVASPHVSSHFCSPCALTMMPSPDAFSYGSGFTPRPDGTRCSWDLTRLIENPGNVLRAVNSCLPGVTQCVHRPWAGAWRLETRAAHSSLRSPAHPQAVAVLRHAVRLLLLAQGGPQPVQHQLLAPRRLEDLARGARLCREGSAEGPEAVCSPPVRGGATTARRRSGLPPVLTPMSATQDPDLLHSLTTLLPPSACAANGASSCQVAPPACRGRLSDAAASPGVELFHTVQHAGEFIVTFPAAFHSGFSHGFNCAEAVNIGDVEWLAYGRSAVDSYRIGPGASWPARLALLLVPPL